MLCPNKLYYNPTAMRAVTYNFFNQPTCTTTTANAQLRNSEIESARGRQCRQAVQTSLCGGIPADLTFWVLFWSSKKVQERVNVMPVNINEYSTRFLATARKDGRAPLHYGRGGRRGGARYYPNASVFRRRAYTTTTKNTVQLRNSEIKNACGRRCRQAVQTSLCGGIPDVINY